MKARGVACGEARGKKPQRKEKKTKKKTPGKEDKERLGGRIESQTGHRWERAES